MTVGCHKVDIGSQVGERKAWRASSDKSVKSEK